MQFAKKTSSGKASIIRLILKLLFGVGKSILFKRKIIPISVNAIRVNFIMIPIILLLELVFLINCI